MTCDNRFPHTQRIADSPNFSVPFRREKGYHHPFDGILEVTSLTRTPSTRGPKFARRDPSVVSQFGGDLTTAAEFVVANVNAGCEGTHPVRSLFTYVIQFCHSYC